MKTAINATFALILGVTAEFKKTVAEAKHDYK
jgi:hypothetical protein